MKKARKIISVLLSLAMLASMTSVVFAQQLPPIGVVNNQEATNIASTILGFIRFIGYGVAIGMILYIGIKYMMSSAADKADLKKGSVNYVIGALLVAGATTIVTMLFGIGGGAPGTGSGN